MISDAALRPAGRVIVLRDGHMLIMKREKPNGQKYMVTPGGRLEPGESAQEAAIREVEEETTVVVDQPKLVFIEDPNDDSWGLQYIFLCQYVSGEPYLSPDSEEYQFQQEGFGTFEPLWLPFTELNSAEYPFRSTRLGEEIRNAITNGFPEVPKEWKLNNL